MKKKTKVPKYLLYLLLICVGVIIGIAFRYFYNESYSEAVSALDFVILGVTIFLVIYIPNVLDKKLKTKRNKKEILTKQLEELQTMFWSVNQLLRDVKSVTEKELLMIKNTLDSSLNKFEEISYSIQHSEMNRSFDKEMARIMDLYRQYRELLISNVEDKKMVAVLDDLRQREDNIHDKLEEAIILLRFKISEASIVV